MSEMVQCHACSGQTLADSRYCSQCGVRLTTGSLVITDAPVSRRREALAATTPGPMPTEDSDDDQPLADPLIGVVIAGRYRIIEPLGRGGMGVVYRVEHARIGKLMALKLLTGELSRDTEVVARFKREALMVSKLSHPNTVQVFDFGTSDGLTYLAMEYLRGEDLGRVIRREGHLTPQRTAKIIIQVCSSLGEAHRLDIIHRDLKPENVFILEGQAGGDLVKVLDFGLAKLRESAELGEVTSRGAIVGTPYYMSPEQIRGEAADQRSDIYSLGALMHMCLTGEPPFDAPRPMGVLTKHLTEAPQNPCARYPDLSLPVGLGNIVMRALEKEPERRFQSVDQLQQALVEELRHEGQPSVEILLDSGQMHALAQSAEDAATRDEVERYERKLRRRGLVASATLLFSIVAGGLVGWRLMVTAAESPTFEGSELEPNNTASEATTVPFGQAVHGQIGRRIDAGRSDRDFYRIQVPPEGKVVSLTLSGLPNMPLCALVYRVGIESPLGTYCVGSSARALEVPALELSAGPHLVAVMQDRDPYGGAAPPVLENVSDSYTLTLAASQTAPGAELEPNDSIKDGNVIAPGTPLVGRLAWMRDVDVVCAKPGSGTVRFVVEDAKLGSRPSSAVLQVTQHGGAADGIPTRVHSAKSGAAHPPNDMPSPWSSGEIEATAEGSACLTLELVPNPLSPPMPKVAPASAEEYTVRVDKL
ncbi:MAG: serine/threonine protein kinase [Myxococcales bacterium]|nr:serine/threonine protein kinase [Myxococcales bacterium]MCB9577640.1 serine/threonine protein kinase [Polyangiaceae bacterium]